MQSPKKVLIVLEMKEMSGRSQLSGILRFLGSSGRWNMHLIQRAAEITPEILRTPSKAYFDGMIAGINASNSDYEEIQKSLFSSHLPTVFLDAEPELSRKNANNAFIRLDDTQIGKTAAHHLTSLGHFSSFGFVPARMQTQWSRIREHAFCSAIAGMGGRCSVFRANQADDKAYHDGLAAWLRALSKPTAIFCAYDTCAVDVVTACHECHVGIPDQAALLGVDDDDFNCNLVSPALSSIRPDFEGEGFLAAKTLDALMDHRTVKRRLMTHKICGITERGSTRPISPSGFLVQRALEYIGGNACNGIGVADVAAYLGISRSLLDLRFRQIQRQSVLATIRRRQLEEVARLLRTTRHSIAHITALCGFKSENHPKKLFRDAFGASMHEYRRVGVAKDQPYRPAR